MCAIYFIGNPTLLLGRESANEFARGVRQPNQLKGHRARAHTLERASSALAAERAHAGEIHLCTLIPAAFF